MIKGEIILDTRVKRKNGYPLRIRVYCTNLQKERYVALKQYQSGKKLKYDNFVLDRGQQLKKEIDHCNKKGFDLGRSITTIKTGIPKLGSTIFMDYLEATIKEKQDRGMAIQDLLSIKREFGNFGALHMELSEMDYNFIKSFITHKKKLGTGDGGISYYIRTASTLFNEAIRMGLIKDNPCRGHRIKRKRTTVLTLPSFEDIKRIIHYEPNKGTLSARANMKRASELFLFQIHIGGHYLSDVSHMEVGNRIKFQRWKNRSHEGGGELVDNMLSDYAVYFIDKYGLDFIPDIRSERTKFNNFRRNYTVTLGRVSRHLDISKKLESSMPRYIFRSAGGYSGASRFAIEQLQGHKPEGITYGYQQKFPYEILDKEHQKILNYIFT